MFVIGKKKSYRACKSCYLQWLYKSLHKTTLMMSLLCHQSSLKLGMSIFFWIESLCYKLEVWCLKDVDVYQVDQIKDVT